MNQEALICCEQKKEEFTQNAYSIGFDELWLEATCTLYQEYIYVLL